MDAVGTEKENQVIEAVYPEIRSVSVDYGIMEKTDGIKVIPAEFGWSDVGSLDALEVLHKADENGNVLIGDVVTVDCKNSIAYSSSRTLTVLGMDGVIAVETKDAILICPKDKAQEVKKIVDELKKSGRENLL
jgi:mannose-1-phosphate guanylyltransferase